MENSEAGMSSDAAQALGGEYQVFLSFRGANTRHEFTDFLYRDLKNAGVRVFRDEDELQEGEVIRDKLLHAIDNSILYIPIFSQDYTSSKSCLYELARMVNNVSMSEDKKCILPIFFNVEPEDVKLKTPPDSVVVLEHEMKCPNEVKEWRKALEVVDKTKGWTVKEKQSQAKIVDSVVETVLKKLEIKRKFVTGKLIGLDEREQDLIDLLDVNNCEVRLIGIYGMGGIGKTTVAKVIYNQFLSHFRECCSFLKDVRVNSLTEEGIVDLQKQLLSDVGDSRSVEQLKDSEYGMQRIGAILSTKKVFVVLDDVDNEEHVKRLIGIGNSSLHSGSRIIITTRNIDVLQVEGFKGEIFPYEMPKMDDDPALQLFCRHAFRQDFPLDVYSGLSNEIVSRIGGLPLAIEVIGSLLYGRGEKIWVEKLEKLKKVPEKKILDKLRISYDDLENHPRQIFLDIACFLFNENKIDASYMWAACEFFPEGGIDVLTKRCLVKTLDNDKFWMHDQLIALGRQIVHEENQNDPRKRSRLWNAEDARQIIGTIKEKGAVQALEISSNGRPIEIKNENFKMLPNLRFLNLKCGTYVGDFATCYSRLKWFSWSYPFDGRNELDWTFRADNLYLGQLVVCKLYGLDFEDDSKAWDLIKRAQHLKVLSITHCNGITTIPDISRCTALERLTIVECFHLQKIESLSGNLQSLCELKIKRCFNLMDIPKDLGALVKLKHFSLSECGYIRELPGSLANLTSLTELDLSGTNIREFFNSIVQLKSLQILHFPFYSMYNGVCHDWQLPSGIGTLVKLEELTFNGHYGMKGEIPIEIGELPVLRILNLGDTGICRIPTTINKLHHLQTLNLSYCHKIPELPELPTSLTNLSLASESLLTIPNLSKLTNLVKLLLSDGSCYTKKSNLKPGCNLTGIGNLSRLKWLKLTLVNVPVPLELTHLSQLEELVLTHLDLKSLVQPSSSTWSWRNLWTLEISHCEVKDIPLDGLSRLENLSVLWGKWLQRLAIPLELRKLQKVRVLQCPELVEIQVMGVSNSLKNLVVCYCDSLTEITGLSYLKNLNELQIAECNVLTNIEGLNELESLKQLIVKSCLSLRWLIDPSCTKISDDCLLIIERCGYSIKNSVQDSLSLDRNIRLKQYREEILPNASNKTSFTIRFHLGEKEPFECPWYFPFSGRERGKRERENKVCYPDSVTYEGLIAEVENFSFRLKRMWCMIDLEVLLEIKCDEDVKYMVQLAARRGLLINLFVEGEDDYKTDVYSYEDGYEIDVYSDEGGAKGDVSCPNEDAISALAGGESKAHGTSSVDDFELERGNAECFEATTSIAEEDSDSVKKQVELHEEPRDEETLTSKCCGEEVFLNTLNKVRHFLPQCVGCLFDSFLGQISSSVDDFELERGNAECFEATTSIAEEDSDSVKKIGGASRRT